jgi:hypothetical protein
VQVVTGTRDAEKVRLGEKDVWKGLLAFSAYLSHPPNSTSGNGSG